MLGNNPVRQQEITDGTSLWIQEIYYSLQGEGPLTGHPSIFVRLAGCNLKCFWCDTDFESSGWKPTLSEIVNLVRELKTAECDLVVITGGEPLRQNIAPLVKVLLEEGMKVQLETNGTLWVDLPEHENLYIVCSPKTEKLNDKLARRITSYKYVLDTDNCCAEDGLPLMSTQLKGKVSKIARPDGESDIWVMPRDTGSPEQNKRNKAKCLEVSKKFNYNLTLQIHKILGIR